jgi:hypothetical protein
MTNGFVEGALRKSNGRGRYGRSEDIERAHRKFESFTLGAQPLAGRNPATLQADGGERMRRNNVNAP